jgi:hypothetical protein
MGRDEFIFPWRISLGKGQLEMNESDRLTNNEQKFIPSVQVYVATCQIEIGFYN